MSDKRRDDIQLEGYRAARDARNLEISLFWQRSNYFLVLSTAIAIGFFTAHEATPRIELSAFGLAVSILWIVVNLGSKFWQSRWEHRLAETERTLAPDLRLFSADRAIVRSDVEESLQFWKRGLRGRPYAQLVLCKPSVSFAMTMLSAVFSALWLVLLIMTALNPASSGNLPRAWGMSIEHSAAIQAIASVISAITVIAALLIAYKALRSSQRQVDTAQEQVEATLLPIVVVQIVGDKVQLKNVGNGPAINLRWEDSDGAKQGRNVFFIGDTAPLTNHFTALVFASLRSPFTASYETLSGAKWTVTAHRDQGVMPEGFRLEIKRG